MNCPICGNKLERLNYSAWLCCDTCELLLPIEYWQDKKVIEDYKKVKGKAVWK